MGSLRSISGADGLLGVTGVSSFRRLRVFALPRVGSFVYIMGKSWKLYDFS